MPRVKQVRRRAGYGNQIPSIPSQSQQPQQQSTTVELEIQNAQPMVDPSSLPQFHLSKYMGIKLNKIYGEKVYVRIGHLSILNDCPLRNLGDILDGDYALRWRTDSPVDDPSSFRFPFFPVRVSKGSRTFNYDLPINAVMACIAFGKASLLREILKTKPPLGEHDDENIDELTFAIMAATTGYKGTADCAFAMLAYYKKHKYQSTLHLNKIYEAAVSIFSKRCSRLKERLVAYHGFSWNEASDYKYSRVRFADVVPESIVSKEDQEFDEILELCMC